MKLAARRGAVAPALARGRRWTRLRPRDRRRARARRRGPRRRSARRRTLHRLDLRRAARADGDPQGRHQTLIGFPALIDQGDAVDDRGLRRARVAAAKHRAGLRRLFALQLKEPLKYLEKNIPDLQKMAVAYMPLGHAEELREQIIEVALERAFLQEPLPTDEASFKRAARRRARPPEPDRATRWRAWPARILVEYAAARAQDQGHAGQPKDVADDAHAAVAAPGAQALPRRHAMGAAAAPAALPQGRSRCAWTSCAPIRRATPRAWPNCGRRSSATGGWWPSARAPWTSAWRNSAGCSKNCA